MIEHDFEDSASRFKIQGLTASYGAKVCLDDINMKIPRNKITALIGPSGCGKSTFIRCLNRMNDFIPVFSYSGDIILDSHNIKEIDPVELRARVGMVFQKPNPFPKSIYENVAYGPKIHGFSDIPQIVESCLIRAGLWDEVKDRLHSTATMLSGGQQQRLCIARALANHPGVILLDEPCSALDPIASGKIEELLYNLKELVTIVIVTHSMGQAKRIADRTAHFHMGELLEYRKTENLFDNPKNEKTIAYLDGAFG